jgi:hypothetical protein
MCQKNKIIKLFVTFCLTLAMMPPIVASAQNAPPTAEQLAVSKNVDGACERAISELRTAFAPNLTSYPELRDKPNLVLLEPHLEFNAIARFRDRQITLTNGLCGQLWLISSAWAFSYEFPALRPRLSDYISQLRMNADRLDTSIGYREIQLLTFPLYVQFPLADVTADQYKRINAFVAISMKESLAFILAHEIGHLALNHQPAQGGAASRLQEHAADKFALELVERSGFSGIGSVPSLLAFLADEARLKHVSASSHPRPECRLNRILTHSTTVRGMLRDKKQHAKFQEMTGKTVDEYRQFMNELREDCIDNP